jgi:methionyl-tRNA synthetase
MAACGRAINVTLQTVRTLTTLMAPFLPHTAEKCRIMLNLSAEDMRWDNATQELPAGRALGEPHLLVRKLDPDEILAV